MASWGSGKPVIALGSDIDCIPQASQKPGVAYRDPIVPGAPGHGEGHNSGVPLNITAALAVKTIMDREKIPGTLRIWPGVAEELVGQFAQQQAALLAGRLFRKGDQLGQARGLDRLGVFGGQGFAHERSSTASDPPADGGAARTEPSRLRIKAGGPSG